MSKKKLKNQGVSSFDELVAYGMEIHPTVEEAAYWVQSQIPGLPDCKEVEARLINGGIRAKMWERNHVIRSASQEKRRAMNANTTTTVPAGNRSASVAAIAQLGNMTVMESYKIGNVRIGDCTAKQIAAQIFSHQQNAGGHVRRAEFLTRVQRYLKSDDQLVREAISPIELESIHDEIIGKSDVEPEGAED